ncbi:MAG: hypothetical protein JXR10_05625 [Cyclobacteriaceae bacterium]
MKTFGILVGLITIGLGGLLMRTGVQEDRLKIDGASLVNPYSEIDSADMATVQSVNAEWVAVIPFGFSKQGQPQLHFNSERQWWGERVDGTKVLVELAQKCGLKVMIKPHVWVSRFWIGEYDLETEADWLIWEQEYRKYIMTYAQLAAETKAEMLCIGTEIKFAATQRPEYWSQLADDIREVYDGKLTYAANWDSFSAITFWDKLDYIGVDAYFPLVHEDNPEVADIVEAWAPIKEELRAFGQKYERPILFTEYGYQSANGAAGNHWEVDKSQLNMQAQANSYQALYEAFSDEPWFVGGFFWKWHFLGDHGGPGNGDFTPQNKPAAQVIAREFAKD